MKAGIQQPLLLKRPAGGLVEKGGKVMIGSYRSFIVRSFVLGLLVSTQAFAAAKYVRWTGQEDPNAQLDHVLEVLSVKTSVAIKSGDFTLYEDRDLATSHFQNFAQKAAGVPLKGRMLRLWTDLKTGKLIQAEAHVEDESVVDSIRLQLFRLARSADDLNQAIPADQTMKIIRAAIAKTDDRLIQDVKYEDQWDQNRLVRSVKVKSRRGVHKLAISLLTQKVVAQSYSEFPQSDLAQDEFSLKASVFPIYEEVEGTGKILKPVESELKYIHTVVSKPVADPYASMRSRKYLEAQYDPVLGETEEGRKEGYWAMSYLKREAAKIRAGMQSQENTYANGVILDGRYATISLHPAVTDKFKGLDFQPQSSVQFHPDWRQTFVEGGVAWEMVPTAAFLGKPITSAEEAAARPSRRLKDHDPVSYINDGFDELQVYYAINTMFDSLHPMGFTDPDLSTRPFNAYLYDPDIGMRDNAYYTDDTINFTTYSPTQQNMARDNPTIWHELGHGVMDRLMGDLITLADTGGLSEGMADFVAELVVQNVTKGIPYEGYSESRIINKTGFFLTNEVHDDGEAYGGAMKDLLDAARAKFGHEQGLAMVTDLTLEAMRLTRNHPALTAQDWFGHMLFADELGREGLRQPGELKAVILSALAGRNFNMDGAPAASLVLKNGENEIRSTGPGSRNSPIPVLTPGSDYTLNISLKESDAYHFQYPVTVKVGLQGGPLQGAIHWEGEEYQPVVRTLTGPGDQAVVFLTARGTCDFVNQEGGGCKDYACVKIFNAGQEDKPAAKKRFYLSITNPTE